MLVLHGALFVAVQLEQAPNHNLIIECYAFSALPTFTVPGANIPTSSRHGSQ
jgi:hypothetical protein